MAKSEFRVTLDKTQNLVYNIPGILHTTLVDYVGKTTAGFSPSEQTIQNTINRLIDVGEIKKTETNGEIKYKGANYIKQLCYFWFHFD